MQVGVLEPCFLVTSESPLLFRAVGITVDELGPRHNVLSFFDPFDGEAFAVGAAVTKPLGRGVKAPAAGPAAVGDGGGGLVVRADADTHVIPK